MGGWRYGRSKRLISSIFPAGTSEPTSSSIGDVLKARVVFAIEAMGTRVAEVAASEKGPRVVLADHLDEQAPILLHRADDLEATLTDLGTRGLSPDRRMELPLGPCVTFRSPGGERLALYQLTRPEVDAVRRPSGLRMTPHRSEPPAWFRGPLWSRGWVRRRPCPPRAAFAPTKAREPHRRLAGPSRDTPARARFSRCCSPAFRMRCS